MSLLLTLKTFSTVFGIKRISCDWSLSVHPENIRKPFIFFRFSGGIERDDWHKMDQSAVFNLHCAKKWSFPLTIFSVNVTKSAISCAVLSSWVNYPNDIYLFRVNNGNTRTIWKIYLKLKIKISEQRYWHYFGVFIVNFKHILYIVLEFLIVTLDK